MMKKLKKRENHLKNIEFPTVNFTAQLTASFINHQTSFHLTR